MARTANINVRTEPETKLGAEQLFASFGISVSDAINIFLHQSLMVGGLPFEVRQPRFNAETEAAMQEARNIASGKIAAKSYASARDLLEEPSSTAPLASTAPLKAPLAARGAGAEGD